MRREVNVSLAFFGHLWAGQIRLCARTDRIGRGWVIERVLITLVEDI